MRAAVTEQQPGAPSSAARSPLRASIPERYCSVHIVAAGGSVSLAGLTEAELHIESHGGDVDVGKVKATHASVATRGGSLAGALTAGSALRHAMFLLQATCVVHARGKSVHVMASGSAAPVFSREPRQAAAC